MAEALEDLCGSRPGARVGELARHWFNATQPIDLGRAIEYSRQAGDAALAGLAPGEALRYYAQALDPSAQTDALDPSLALDLAIGLGTAQRQAGDPGYRAVLLDAAYQAIRLDDTTRLVQVILASDRGFFSVSGIDSANIEVLETALERLPADGLDRALVLAILCQELTFGSSLERREALADEAVSIAVAHADSTATPRPQPRLGAPAGAGSARTVPRALGRGRAVGRPDRRPCAPVLGGGPSDDHHRLLRGCRRDGPVPRDGR